MSKQAKKTPENARVGIRTNPPGHRVDTVRPGYNTAYAVIGRRTFVLFYVQKVSKFQ